MKKLLTYLTISAGLVLFLPTPALAHGGMEGIIMLPLIGIWALAIFLSIMLLVVCCKMSSLVVACIMAVINAVLLGVMWYGYYVSALSYTFAIRRGVHPSHLFGENFIMFMVTTIGFFLLLNVFIAAFKMGRYKYIALGVLLGMFIVAFLLTVPKLKKEQSITALIDNINKRPVPFGRTDFPQEEQDFSRLKEMEPNIKRYAFFKAAGEGNTAVIKILLDEMSPEEINSAFYKAMNNPHYDACNTDENALEIMTLLLEKGADINYETEYLISNETYSTTPLTRAAECRELSLVKFLLDHGANVNQTAKHGNDYKETALSNAYEKGDKEITKLLLERGADINIPGGNWGTILGYAVRYNDMAEIQWVLDQKIDVNASIPGGSTPLHSAADKGKDDVVELLISHGANVNAVTQRFNHSPLFEAVEEKHLSTVKILLEHGADPNIPSRDVYEGKTVLDLAPTQEIKDLLRQYGAKTGEELKEEAASKVAAVEDTSALQAARPVNTAGQEDIKAKPVDNPTDELQEEPARFYMGTGAEGITKAAKILLDNDTPQQQKLIKPEERTQQIPAKGDKQKLQSSFVHLCRWGTASEVEKLLDLGVDVNTPVLGQTPLKNAILGEKPEIVKLLLKHGATVTPSLLNLANSQHNEEVIEILKSAGAKE